MDTLIAFLLRHAAIGFAIGVVFTGLLFTMDIGGLRSLFAGSPAGWAAAALMAFFVGSTFSAAQMGMAVMLEGRDTDSEGGDGDTD